MSKRTTISYTAGASRAAAITPRDGIGLAVLACGWAALFASDLDWVPDLPYELHDDLGRVLLAATIIVTVGWVLKVTALRRAPGPAPEAAQRRYPVGSGYAEGVIDGMALRVAGGDNEPTRDLSASISAGNLAVMRPRRK